MQLYLSTRSPYARLSLIAAYRANKQDLTLHFVKPWENPAELEAVNPYSQIPALVHDNGLVITESLIIMQSFAGNLFSGGRSDALLGYAMATINQIVRYVSMNMVAADTAGSAMQARSLAALEKALPHAPLLNPQGNDWGNICLGVAYRYLEMRLPEIYARRLSADNKAVLKIFCRRDFMRKTESAELEKLPKTLADL